MKKASIVFFQVDYARLISVLDWVKNGERPRCPTVVCVQVSISVSSQQEGGTLADFMFQVDSWKPNPKGRGPVKYREMVEELIKRAI